MFFFTTPWWVEPPDKRLAAKWMHRLLHSTSAKHPNFSGLRPLIAGIREFKDSTTRHSPVPELRRPRSAGDYQTDVRFAHSAEEFLDPFGHVIEKNTHVRFQERCRGRSGYPLNTSDRPDSRRVVIVKYVPLRQTVLLSIVVRRRSRQATQKRQRILRTSLPQSA